MGSAEEPLTPAGRLFLRPEMDQVINCALGLESPLDAEAAKPLIRDSFLLHHPRFRSLVVRDPAGGGPERWRQTDVDLDRHLIVVDGSVSASAADDDAAVNEYLADLSTGPGLSPDKPLWEIHFLTAHRCVIFRIHHSLGDGISLMSLLLSSCRKASDPTAMPEIAPARSTNRAEGKARVSLWKRVVELLGIVWFSLIYVLEFLVKLFWLRDRDTVISGGDGVELWPRKLATARFQLEDMKAVKRAVRGATINDVLFGVISSGLSRYLDHRTPNAHPEGLQITGLAMVNLRKQPGLQELSDMMKSNSQSRWGNKFGIILLPIQYHKSNTGSDPLDCLKRAKAMIDRKKRSIEAHFSYQIGYYVMSYLGSKFAGFLNYRIICNTSFTVSNVIGPQEEIALGNKRVTYMRVNLSSLPHALTMHMLSYAGRGDMQILVAKDIIPDPEFLAKCFEDALLEMKDAALASVKTC